MPEEKLLFSSSLSALMRTPKKRTMEKRIGNRLPIRAICFSFIFSSVLSSLQGYGSFRYVPLYALIVQRSVSL